MSVSLQFPPGVILGRDFEILRVIGRGGMGTVYEAKQHTTNALRALKVMRSGLASDPRFRSRFEQEARISSTIASDHIVQVVSSGVDETTQMPWIAMELLDGEDLGKRLARYAQNQHSVMAVSEIVLIVQQLAHALTEAHRVGVVHRDLKPENIFLAKSRVVGMPLIVKVLDFGVARLLANARATTAVGTPAYMAPEQTESSSEVGPQADVWAFGLIVFQLLTGFAFWKAANQVEPHLMTLWRESLIDPIPTASERAQEYQSKGVLPSGFDEWFARCVVRDVSERFVNIGQAFEQVAPLMAVVANSPQTLRTPIPLSQSLPVTLVAQTVPSPLTSLVSSRDKPLKITYRDGGERVIVDGVKGASLLEVSLENSVPHFHACGGKARCTTCRVVVLEGASRLTPRTEAESLVALKRKWPSSIRLACQARVLGDVTIRRLVLDNDDLTIVNAVQTGDEPTITQAAILAAKINEFSEFSKEHLPHDVIHVLNRYLRQICDPAKSHQGVILRYEYDGVVLMFPIQQGDEKDAAIRAVRTAMRALIRVQKLNGYVLKHFGQAFRLSFGLHIGEVISATVQAKSDTASLHFGEGLTGAVRAVNHGMSATVNIVATNRVVSVASDVLRLGETIEVSEKEKLREIVDFAKPDTVFLVQSAFEQLLGKEGMFAEQFYDELFNTHPPIASLFDHVDMAAQQGMLMNVLSTAIKGLDNIDDLVPTLRSLGARHVGYGVEVSHYRFVGKALLKTLEKFLGELFTPEVHLAWMEIYGIIAKVMIEGASDNTVTEQNIGT